MIENAVLHRIMNKIYKNFYENSEILSKKWTLGLSFSEKHQSEANKFCQAAKQWFSNFTCKFLYYQRALKMFDFQK